MKSRVSRRRSLAESAIRRLLGTSPKAGVSSVNPYARLGRLAGLHDAAAQELLIPELGRENPDERHPLAHTGCPAGPAATDQPGNPLGVPEAGLSQGGR